MIIRSKAPLRLGLAGGGSDVSPYCDIYGGLVLNATINLNAYCTIEETNDNQITICSYDADVYKSYPISSLLEIDGDASLIKGVYNRVVRDFNLQPQAFRITTYNDAPAGSGLGTSSTMVVCILKAFVEWKGLPLGNPTYINKVDRPQGHYDVEEQIECLALFNGHCIIQTMLMKGEYEGQSLDNTTEEFVVPYLEALARIKPQAVMLYTLDRETPVSGLEKATPEAMQSIASRIRSLGIEVSVSC